MSYSSLHIISSKLWNVVSTCQCSLCLQSGQYPASQAIDWVGRETLPLAKLSMPYVSQTGYVTTKLESVTASIWLTMLLKAGKCAAFCDRDIKDCCIVVNYL